MNIFFTFFFLFLLTQDLPAKSTAPTVTFKIKTFDKNNYSFKLSLIQVPELSEILVSERILKALMEKKFFVDENNYPKSVAPHFSVKTISNRALKIEDGIFPSNIFRQTGDVLNLAFASYIFTIPKKLRQEYKKVFENLDWVHIREQEKFEFRKYVERNLQDILAKFSSETFTNKPNPVASPIAAHYFTKRANQKENFQDDHRNFCHDYFQETFNFLKQKLATLHSKKRIEALNIWLEKVAASGFHSSKKIRFSGSMKKISIQKPPLLQKFYFYLLIENEKEFSHFAKPAFYSSHQIRKLGYFFESFKKTCFAKTFSGVDEFKRCNLRNLSDKFFWARFRLTNHDFKFLVPMGD